MIKPAEAARRVIELGEKAADNAAYPDDEPANRLRFVDAACGFARNPDSLAALLKEIENAAALLKIAWEAGFALAVGYGDNHFHFHGEQKERQWKKFLGQHDAGQAMTAENLASRRVADVSACIMDSVCQEIALFNAENGVDWWQERSEKFSGRMGLYYAVAGLACEAEEQLSTDDWEASSLYEVADWIAAELVSDTFTGNIVPLLIAHIHGLVVTPSAITTPGASEWTSL